MRKIAVSTFAGLFAAVLAASSGPSVSARDPSAPTSSLLPHTIRIAPRSLTPSIPSIFRTGTNNCGDPWAINATTTLRTVPLLDCPGLAGLRPTPTVKVDVGSAVLISGLPKTATGHGPPR